ncbi:ferredoxin [Aliishimia ponticola]|uniref:Ferredoxin n=1 Tax=Aliishimia ponticola TaxID=2499833 RepID=A0A4S4N8Z2_9RHOB|nr:ferredoxin [Aliishimia ponticola]THH34461.1 ferredoxin [Aliishimia ponticola]
MTPEDVNRAVAPAGLFVMGSLKVDDGGLILIGAAPAMWPVFTQSPEYNDGRADPLDRWSKRVIGTVAADTKAEALFPSDGPPYLPFIAWALGSGQFWQSPTGMMVHDRAGLMISIRGALRGAALSVGDPVTAPSPCTGCVGTPCATACPVSALSTDAPYDVPTCKAYIRAPQGADCLTGGCLVRRACPVSQSFGRAPEQSGFHMRAFVGA